MHNNNLIVSLAVGVVLNSLYKNIDENYVITYFSEECFTLTRRQARGGHQTAGEPPVCRMSVHTKKIMFDFHTSQARVSRIKVFWKLYEVFFSVVLSEKVKKKKNRKT